MVVLGIAEPHRSSKYEAAVCVAGITIHGDFRRIYSVPMKYYVNAKFKKYQYIRYEVVDRGGDGRRESRKVDRNSIEPLDFASPSTISALIRNNTTTLEYLRDSTNRSLGIVRPVSLNYVGADEYGGTKTARYTRLRGSTERLRLLPSWIKLQFSCRPSLQLSFNSVRGHRNRKLLPAGTQKCIFVDGH